MGESSVPTTLRTPGAILVVSCYELGHQPLGLAWPMEFLERAGFAPRALDLALEPLDETVVQGASLAAIMAPMHTALRLGVPAPARPGGLCRSQSGVRAPLSALPHPAGVRRPFLRGASHRGSGGHPSAGRGRGRPYLLR